MHIDLILGVCVVGFQLVGASAIPEHRHDDKTKWVTEVKTVLAHVTAVPTKWADTWGPKDAKPTHNHKSTKQPHDNEPAHKHVDGQKSKHANPSPDPKPNKQHEETHDSKEHESKHHSEKPSHSTQHAPAHTQARAQGSPPTYTSGGAGLSPPYQQQVVHNHNVHRSNHSSPKITWSDSLAATAAKIAATCVFQHSMNVDGGGYGQNIAAGAPAASISHVISDQFYNGEVNYFAGQYGNPNPTGFETWGHFSQVVWSNTRNVGCATQDCTAAGGVGNTGSDVPPYFTVCNYGPPGNVGGQYAINIGNPLGRPTIRGHGAQGAHH